MLNANDVLRQKAVRTHQVAGPIFRIVERVDLSVDYASKMIITPYRGFEELLWPSNIRTFPPGSTLKPVSHVRPFSSPYHRLHRPILWFGRFRRFGSSSTDLELRFEIQIYRPMSKSFCHPWTQNRFFFVVERIGFVNLPSGSPGNGYIRSQIVIGNREAMPWTGPVGHSVAPPSRGNWSPLSSCIRAPSHVVRMVYYGDAGTLTYHSYLERIEQDSRRDKLRDSSGSSPKGLRVRSRSVSGGVCGSLRLRRARIVRQRHSNDPYKHYKTKLRMRKVQHMPTVMLLERSQRDMLVSSVAIAAALLGILPLSAHAARKHCCLFQD
ncbi:unnamed protein product [Nesidiocoris tenuis]|uniref:Uncharacterized protein n=1 Tax=Nesidiocoris tenuis TaxID=355587 RepID=A0A6H5FW60_9HEMI|nr:unnamed protein product [Nesidiocoris tenuis]